MKLISDKMKIKKMPHYRNKKWRCKAEPECLTLRLIIQGNRYKINLQLRGMQFYPDIGICRHLPQIYSYLMTISLNREGTLKDSNNEHIYEFHAIGMCVGTLALEFGIEARNHTSDAMLVIRPHKFQLYEMFG